MESTFAAQLHTNYVPSSSEVEEIRIFVSGSLEERSCLADKIARFQTIIDDLRDQCIKLGTHTKDHLALTSGARRLPRKIVQEVFRHCLPTDTNAVMCSEEPPLLLGQICSDWRKIALSTPNLWATLHVCIPECHASIPHVKWNHITEAVKTWLDLSGDLPLAISVAHLAFTVEQPAIRTSFRIESLMNILIQHSRRWERINFALPLPDLTAAIAPLTEADVPLLASASLASSDAIFFSPNSWPTVSILNTPTLRELSIIYFKYTDCLQTHPWTQLTALCLEDTVGLWDGPPRLSEIDALNILKQCPLLITCKLLVEADPLSPPQPTLHEVALPFLRSLILTEDMKFLRSQFVDCLKVPLLNYLGIRSYFRTQYIPSHPRIAVSTFFTRANVIEELHLDLGASSSETWRECLLYAKNVRKLTLVGPRYSPLEGHVLNDRFLSRLTPFPDDGLLCPSLEEITFEYCQGFSDENILLFLQGRTNPAHAAGGMTVLKRATFTVDREVVTDIKPDTQPLIAAGLKLNLSHIPPPSFIFEENTKVVDVPNGPKLIVTYPSQTFVHKFSPYHGLPTYRMMNVLH